MASVPGEIRQLGFVVRDLDEAVAHWLHHTKAGPSVRAFFELSEGLTRTWDGVSAPVRRFDEVAG